MRWIHKLLLLAGVTAAFAASAGDVVNINTATRVGLMSVEGISRAQAQAIVDYRDEFGAFDAVSQLLSVDGVGAATVNAIHDDVTVGSE